MITTKLLKLSKQVPKLRTMITRSFTAKTLKTPAFRFSDDVKPSIDTTIDADIKVENTETYSFQTETQKLLHIVAHSIYTDKDVFLRELLSNCSDAIEKQRYFELTGASKSDDPLQINIMTNEEKRQLIIQDTGIGMSRQDMIDNLGTIASSGSKKFLENLKKEGVSTTDIQGNLIGQFGVGFYSSFIVGDSVQVISKREGDQHAYVWVSDGSGSYNISQTDDFHLNRGTKIIIHLKPEFAQYSRSEDIKNVVDKYSNFIQHPIFLNHEKMNIVTALWSRDKKNVTEQEYKDFYEYVSKTKSDYRYKLHYSVDVPLSIKALLYIPSQNSEMFGMNSTEINLQLYSRRVLIKNHAKELLPNYLRFIKGVVDCEDIPLNISRETYQDSNLIMKIRSLLTKRILKLLEQESKKDEQTYNNWHKDFHMFIKEGLHSDRENSELLLSLSRFNTTFGDTKSLDDYIKHAKKDQNTIYYFLAPNAEIANHSPYMEVYAKNEVPVLFISISVEEMIFRQIGQYKNFNFVNIESQEAELPKELIKEQKEIEINKEKLPADDVQAFSQWIRNELQPVVTKVNVSKKLSSSPAVILSDITSGMRQMLAFMDQKQLNEMSKNLTFEVNPEHPIINSMNRLRKTDPKGASFALKQLLDLCLLAVGIPFDVKVFMQRSNKLIESNLNTLLNNKGDKVIEPIVEDSCDGKEVKISDDAEDVLNNIMNASTKKRNSKVKIEMNEKGEPDVKSN